MNQSKPFYDLCIQESCTFDFLNLSNKLVEYGFKTVAINQVIDVEFPEASKKKKKKESRWNQDVVPPPISLKNTQKHDDLTVLNRLTLIFSDKANVHKVIQSENFKKYHLFAVIPKNNESLQYACDSLETDIISFDSLDSKLIKFNRKLYNTVVSKNMFFELMYSPALIDSTSRKNIIQLGHQYHLTGKSKNIIITSGAKSIMQIRGPYDIINLGLILGLSEEQSKLAISTACKNLINRSIGRKIGKTIVLVSSKINDEEMEIEENEEPTQKKMKN